jgi:D-aminopeptidase
MTWMVTAKKGNGRRAAPAVVGRARAADLGLSPGGLPTGQLNAITDVPGIRVGHVTLIEAAGAEHGELRTGVTALVHDRLLGSGTLPAGLAVLNGYGKMVGSTQLAELGTVETPVLLTSTLCTFRVADAVLSYLHGLPGNEELGTLNPVVAETNDGYLSDIWARPVTADHVSAALVGAAGGVVPEGCVGAGTGTRALGFKAGIGTASRVARLGNADVNVGALVQANFSGTLTVAGVPVPAAPVLADTVLANTVLADTGLADTGLADTGLADTGNSCVIVLATDACLDARQLGRVARRAFAAMARTGSDFTGRSGDYALAMSTAGGEEGAGRAEPVPEMDLDLLFTAAIDATEEAILNSLFMAETTTGFRGHVKHAVPLDHVRELVRSRPAAPSAS